MPHIPAFGFTVCLSSRIFELDSTALITCRSAFGCWSARSEQWRLLNAINNRHVEAYAHEAGALWAVPHVQEGYLQECVATVRKRVKSLSRNRHETWLSIGKTARCKSNSSILCRFHKNTLRRSRKPALNAILTFLYWLDKMESAFVRQCRTVRFIRDMLYARSMDDKQYNSTCSISLSSCEPLSANWQYKCSWGVTSVTYTERKLALRSVGSSSGFSSFGSS